MKYNQLKAELFAAGCFPLRGEENTKCGFLLSPGSAFRFLTTVPRRFLLQPSVTSERIQESIKS